MKRFLSVLALLVAALTLLPVVGAAPALVVNTKSLGTNSSSATVDTTGANLLVAVVSRVYNTAVDVPLSDSKSNTWVHLSNYNSPDGNTTDNVTIFYVVNPSVGTGHIFYIGTNADSPAAIFMAFSGMATSTPYDKSDGIGLSELTNNITTPAITPAGDGYLLIAGLSDNQTGTVYNAGGSFTLVEQVFGNLWTSLGLCAAYYVQPSAGSISAVWNTDTGTRAAITAAFKVSGGAPPPTTRRRVIISQ